MKKITSVLMAMLILLFGAVVFFDKSVPPMGEEVLSDSSSVVPLLIGETKTNGPPKIQEPTEISVELNLPAVTPQMADLPSETPIPISHPTPTPTPTPTPIIINYVINSSIDLASGLPVAMAIEKTDGKVVKSNWALAVAYQDGNVDLFQARKGTVYSHVDDGFVATWAHSGRIGEVPLFGFELEKAVWINSQGVPVTLDEGLKMTEELIGSKMVLCQASLQAEKQPFEIFDLDETCSGVRLEFVVTAATLIERELVNDYEKATGNLVDWLLINKPGKGFEDLQTRDGYLIQTCVGRYSDQKSDGTADYVYNRLVIGFTLVP